MATTNEELLREFEIGLTEILDAFNARHSTIEEIAKKAMDMGVDMGYELGYNQGQDDAQNRRGV